MYSRISGFLGKIRLLYWVLRIRLAIAKHKANKAPKDASVAKEENLDEQALPDKAPQSLTVLELFSGIGGTRLGAEQAGFKIVASSEIDKHCTATYQDNFGEAPLGDITKIKADELPDFSVLTASTPCQSFSTQGKRKGLKDDRGQLIHDVLRIIDGKKPKVVFIENVKGMATTNNGQGLKYVLKELKSRGYHTHWKILKASEYGVPQNRERLFIVAFAENVPFSFPKPTVLPAPSGDILEKSAHENYYLTQSEIDTQVEAKIRYDRKGHNFGFEIIDPKKPSHTLLRSESSLRKNLVAVPLDKKAPASRGIHELKEASGKAKKIHLRKLTPRECARLQGFPDSYKLTSSTAQTYKQMGNSVPVPVIRELFKEILVSLTLGESEVRASTVTPKTVNPAPPTKKPVTPKKAIASVKAPPKRKSSRKAKKLVRPPTNLNLKPSYGFSRLSAVRKSIPPVFPESVNKTEESVINELKNWHLKDKKNHFMTPKWLVEFIKFVFPIELDAASSPEANAINGFERIYTKSDNAQRKNWKVQDGKGVFINPPYKDRHQLKGWAKKIISEYEKNRQPIFVLVPARNFESESYRLYFKHATHIVFLKKRLVHNELFNQELANFPSAIIVFGGDQLGERISLLSELGECVETSAYRESKLQTVSQLRSEAKKQMSAA